MATATHKLDRQQGNPKGAIPLVFFIASMVLAAGPLPWLVTLYSTVICVATFCEWYESCLTPQGIGGEPILRGGNNAPQA